MKKLGLLILLILFTTFSVNAQTTLSAGDIAIVGINCDDPDDFAFVLLTDITTNTVINFTDNGWFAVGGFRPGEGVLTYTAPSNLTAGTVIIYSVSAANFTSSGTFALAVAGDQLIAFQGTLASPTPIYGLNNDGAGVWQTDATSANTSALPTGLSNGFSAVAINEFDNAYYSDGPYVDLDILRSAIGDLNNWTGDDNNRYNFTTVFNGNLPVELTSFSAAVIGKDVKLSWNTATEINNFGFEIERSVISNGVRNLNWEKIGFINGNGNSNSPKSYSFVDDKVNAGKYSYRLKQIDNDGQFEYSKTIEVDVNGVKEYKLTQNYPNPFNPATTIQYILPQAGMVKLTLYNILGQEIRTLVNEMKEAGTHTINIDASDLKSGMYIYKIESGSFVQTRKMTLVK